jgi:Tol biopolymer transport system component
MVVSPDGSTFAATSTQGTSQTRQIFLFPVSGGSTQLTSMSADADQPAFSPDGKSIAFHSANSIYVINVDGTGLRPVVVSSDPVAFGFDYEHPTFTPDGSRIIVDRENEIESFDLAGGERPIVGNFTGEEVYPAVSRDGLELAFITDVGCYPNQGAYRVALTALDGFLPHPCEACWGSGSNLGVLTHPSWGPRGLLVLSHVSNDGVKRLVVLDTTNPSAVPVEILPQRGDQLNPVWAPGTLNLP